MPLPSQVVTFPFAIARPFHAAATVVRLVLKQNHISERLADDFFNEITLVIASLIHF